MPAQTIKTPHAPAAIGPYSQGKRAGTLVFTAGQLAFDPATGKLIAGGIREQTEQVLKNIAAILQAAGTDLSRVVKTTVFLANLADFPAMNEVYAQFFKDEPPARSTVQAALLRDALIEIEAIASVE
ncbi:MAG: RidA family protein [Chloroflexi bacterium]|nr:RidA family protein [Chloroflexota bacterium]